MGGSSTSRVPRAVCVAVHLGTGRRPGRLGRRGTQARLLGAIGGRVALRTSRGRLPEQDCDGCVCGALPLDNVIAPEETADLELPDLLVGTHGGPKERLQSRTRVDGGHRLVGVLVLPSVHAESDTTDLKLEDRLSCAGSRLTAHRRSRDQEQRLDSRLGLSDRGGGSLLKLEGGLARHVRLNPRQRSDGAKSPIGQRSKQSRCESSPPPTDSGSWLGPAEAMRHATQSDLDHEAAVTTGRDAPCRPSRAPHNDVALPGELRLPGVSTVGETARDLDLGHRLDAPHAGSAPVDAFRSSRGSLGCMMATEFLSKAIPPSVSSGPKGARTPDGRTRINDSSMLAPALTSPPRSGSVGDAPCRRWPSGVATGRVNGPDASCGGSGVIRYCHAGSHEHGRDCD